jgi:tight adherence protein C
MSLQLVILAGVAGAGVLVAAWGYLSPKRKQTPEELTAERLARYGAGVRKLNPDEMALATTTLYERIVRPQMEKIRLKLAGMTSTEYRKKTEIDLALANNPMGYGDYVALQVLAPAIGVLAGLGLGKLTQSLTVALLLAVVLAVAGVVAPRAMLKSAIKEQRRRYSRALPDLIDFLVVVVEAGLGFDQAVERVIAKFDNALTAAFAQVMHEIELGRPRVEAYEAMGARSGVEALNTFIQTVLTSERMGTAMGATLRMQSDDVRWRRREKAREMGAKAALKMTVPMVIFIFPAIWVVLLGPALFAFLKHGL